MEKNQNLKNQKGFTLIELLIVIAIIGILAAIAFPQFAAYRSRSFGATVTTDLQNVYLSCKAFWSDNTPTTDCVSAPGVGIQGVQYGFLPTAGVTVTIPVGALGQEAGFITTATHVSIPTVTWTVGPNGNIANDGGF